MELTKLPNPVGIVSSGTGIAGAVSKPADLGIGNLANVAGFVQSASALGLSNAGKISSFLNVSASVGALASGNISAATAVGCISAAGQSGLVPPNLVKVDQVMSLINTGKALGISPGNINEKVPAIMDKAEQTGINPKQSQDNAKQNEPHPSVGPAITGHKLRFEPYEFANILDVRIRQNINEHGTMYVKGVLKADTQGGDSRQSDDHTIQETTAGTAAALYSVDEEGTVECLFQGLIVNVKQAQTTDVKTIEVEVISPSHNLDIRKNSRSFQRKTAAYDDIIEIVNNGQAEIKNNESSKQTGKFIVQYKETDWEFLKRIASHHNTGLVPVINSDTIQIHFGVPTGQKAKVITTSSYSVKKEVGEFRTTQANDITHSRPSLSDSDFICYQVTSLERLTIGDSVDFLKHTLYVRSIETKLEQGVLTYHYALVSKAGLFQKDMFNPALAGTSLMAQVKVITKDQIKAHIVEVDPEWDSGADWYFPYSTVFSSPDGSGWYAMPEPGDTVRIYFPTHKDEEAVAASSVNRDQSAQSQQQTAGGEVNAAGSGDAPRTDPNKKSFSNKYGKEILLTPDGIYITNQAGKIFINLTDDKGITIVSELDISLTSKANIILNAAQNIVLNAKENLSMTCKQASIKSDKSGLIEFKGEQVKAN